MNGRQVLDWIRSNVFIVVFSAIMLAALVALPLVASRMNAGVRETVEQRLAEKRALEALEKTSIQIPQPGGRPPIAKTTLVNEQTLNRYLEVVEREKEDADRILAAALDFNRKDRRPVMDGALPDSTLDASVLGRNWHRAIGEAWERLFAEARAGLPADPVETAEQLRRRERLFLTQTLQKDPSEALTAEEQARLAEHLAGARLGLYAEHADDLGFYLDADARPVPVFDIRYTYSPDDLFAQQWEYWVVEDVLRAVADLNGTASVRVAPVKRVRSLVVEPAQAPSAGPAPGGGRGRGGQAPSGPAPMPIGASAFGSIGLNDVRNVDLDLVVETAKLPALVDALGRRNFMTVLDMAVEPEDAFAAAADGCFYGNEPVSRVRMRIETVWFREWTSPFMPAATKQALGVPAPVAGIPDGQG